MVSGAGEGVSYNVECMSRRGMYKVAVDVYAEEGVVRLGIQRQANSNTPLGPFKAICVRKQVDDLRGNAYKSL